MDIRKRLLQIGVVDMGLWKQKQITVQENISLADGIASLIENNIPNGVTFVMIVKDNLDASLFTNNQMVWGIYDSVNANNNNWSRYQSGDYRQIGAGANTWTNTYALAALQGDRYTIFYQ